MGGRSHGSEGTNEGEGEAGSCGCHCESGSSQPIRGECVYDSFTWRNTQDFQQLFDPWLPFEAGREVFKHL